MSSRPTVLLLVLVLTLGGILTWELRRGPAGTPEIGLRGEADADGVAPSAPAVPALPRLDHLTQTVKRPLFSKDRRPPEPAADEGVETPAVVSAASATGIVLSAVVIDGHERRALLRDPSSGRSVWLSRGDTLGGWSLAEIRADAVLLRNGMRTETIPLRRFERVRPPLPAAKPAAPLPGMAGTRAPQAPAPPPD